VGHSDNRTHHSDGADETGPEYEATAALPDSPPSPTEKILVLLTPHPSTAALVRRGKRVADYFKGECVAVAICRDGRLGSLPAADREALEKHLKFAQDLHVSCHLLSGQDVAEKLASFAHDSHVTQIYLSRPKTQFWSSLLNRDLIQRITRLTGNIEITIAAERARTRGLTNFTTQQADAHSLPVHLADEAICIGPAHARDSYLNIPAIISAALIFYILTIAGVIRLRHTRPAAERAYRAFG